MDSSGKFSYSLRKYPVVRVLSVVFIISIILGSIYLIGFRNKPVPEIFSVVPPVGSPGEPTGGTTETISGTGLFLKPMR